MGKYLLYGVVGSSLNECVLGSTPWLRFYPVMFSIVVIQFFL